MYTENLRKNFPLDPYPTPNRTAISIGRERQDYGKLAERAGRLRGPVVEGRLDPPPVALALGRAGHDAPVLEGARDITGQEEGVLVRHAQEVRARIA